MRTPSLRRARAGVHRLARGAPGAGGALRVPRARLQASSEAQTPLGAERGAWLAPGLRHASDSRAHGHLDAQRADHTRHRAAGHGSGGGVALRRRAGRVGVPARRHRARGAGLDRVVRDRAGRRALRAGRHGLPAVDARQPAGVLHRRVRAVGRASSRRADVDHRLPVRQRAARPGTGDRHGRGRVERRDHALSYSAAERHGHAAARRLVRHRRRRDRGAGPRESRIARAGALGDRGGRAAR